MTMSLREIIKQYTEWPTGSTLHSILYHQDGEAHFENTVTGAIEATESTKF